QLLPSSPVLFHKPCAAAASEIYVESAKSRGHKRSRRRQQTESKKKTIPRNLPPGRRRRAPEMGSREWKESAERNGGGAVSALSYLNSKDRFKNKTCGQRHDKKQHDPIPLNTHQFNIPLGVIDGDGLDQATVRQRRFNRK